ncbi:uncharacterized protein K02A2.6-like [Leptopilina heterotoma]|uniref:uncharacterized protein K02A2.6-like n=1 Tax=Leptopilina heterotoma TaxID=63436 RepID=UPI001CA8A2E4|nr:uncharacterized protein K02A2.6-like [Leptopilina heterotoma]
MAASRVQRWAVFLSGYNYKIKYIEGKNNNANCFSRFPVKNDKKEIDCETNEYSYLNFVTNDIEVISTDVLRNKIDNDCELKTVKRFILEGWPSKVSDDLKKYASKNRELTIENGCVMWGHRIAIPSTLRKELLAELHSAHMGVVKMKTLARSYIWGPNIDKDIELIGKSCESCLKNADNPPKANLHSWDWPNGPNHRIHADFLGPVSGEMFLIIVDAYSKWVDVKLMKNITAENTIRAFKEYFCTWGLPFKLVTDNGPTFTSFAFRDFVLKNGIRHIKTPPYHPASNGAAENAVRTFKSKFELLRLETDSQDALVKYLFYWRSTPHCSTGVSPAELQCNRKFRNRFDLLKIEVKETVIRSQESQKKFFHGNRAIQFKNNEVVMARDYMAENWQKSEIEKQLGLVTYQVRTENNKLWKRHVDQLRPCNLSLDRKGRETESVGGERVVDMNAGVLNKSSIDNKVFSEKGFA